jgi:hypothetical protein
MMRASYNAWPGMRLQSLELTGTYQVERVLPLALQQQRQLTSLAVASSPGPQAGVYPGAPPLVCWGAVEDEAPPLVLVALPGLHDMRSLRSLSLAAPAMQLTLPGLPSLEHLSLDTAMLQTPVGQEAGYAMLGGQQLQQLTLTPPADAASWRALLGDPSRLDQLPALHIVSRGQQDVTKMVTMAACAAAGLRELHLLGPVTVPLDGTAAMWLSRLLQLTSLHWLTRRSDADGLAAIGQLPQLAELSLELAGKCKLMYFDTWREVLPQLHELQFLRIKRECWGVCIAARKADKVGCSSRSIHAVERVVACGPVDVPTLDVSAWRRVGL